jgi:nucleotide-binding universal stress UspA family protein
MIPWLQIKERPDVDHSSSFLISISLKKQKVRKILVPTDFSEHSKAGLRFALQWLSIEEIELVFIHVLHISRPPEWTDAYYLEYSENKKKNDQERLEQFVAGVFGTMNKKLERYSCVVIEGFSADIAILGYCRRRRDIDFICIATRGAGWTKRWLGTNTGNLITKSKVPVIAVPAAYRVKPFERLIYAADFHHYKKELETVIDFARPLKIPVEVIHFSWPDEARLDKEVIESGVQQEFRYPVQLHIEQNDAVHSLVQNLQKQIDILKPSMAIMFTNQDRSLFEKIFLSSKAEQLSFDLKIPLLVFNKS